MSFDLVVIDILNFKETEKKFSSSYVREMITDGNFQEVLQC